MKIFDIDARVNEVDMTTLAAYTKWHQNSIFFEQPMGQEHYRLLAFLSHQLDNGETVYDIGTYLGFSALALAANTNINVVTFDLVDHIQTPLYNTKQRPNITFKIADCTQAEHIGSLAKAQLVMLDVDPHDGVQEPQIVKALQDAGFRGLLLLDDIHLNEPMKQFWESLSLKKYDITKYGHHSGTGIVVFDETFCDVRIA